ncbi:MAG: tripartite tricarboxylate transporter TctB family protein [Desulfobacterales bacterium]|nr:tripartite tricarboxylate transporter TctB family protein [Desulfobacterales bacterium]
MRAKTGFLIVILAATAAAMAVASGFPYWQAKIAPMTVCGLILLLGGVQLIKEIISSPAEGQGIEGIENAPQAAESLRVYLLEGAWMVGFVAAIYFFGLLIAMACYGVAYMRTHGATWSMSFIVTALMTLFSYAVFSYVLEVTFYPGIIFE